MSALGRKLLRLEGGLVAFRCPGCHRSHQVGIEPPATVIWDFNGSGDAPTFTPSVLVQGSARLTEDEYQRVMAGESVQTAKTVCHSFVTDGRIQFLGDCTHALAGQTVDLPDWPASGSDAP